MAYKQWTFIVHNGVWKSKIRAPAWSCLMETLFLVPSWCLLAVTSYGKGGQRSLWSHFYKALTLFIRPHPHDLSTPERPYLLILSTLRIKISTYNVGKGRYKYSDQQGGKILEYLNILAFHRTALPSCKAHASSASPSPCFICFEMWRMDSVTWCGFWWSSISPHLENFYFSSWYCSSNLRI